MFKKITDLIRYISTPDNRGVGVANLAYDPAFTFPQQSVYNPKYNVRRQLAPTAPAFFKPRQNVPTIPIEGNGLELQGQMALQMLQQASKEKSKADA